MLKVINPLKNKFKKNAVERPEPGAALQNRPQKNSFYYIGHPHPDPWRTRNSNTDTQKTKFSKGIIIPKPP
jgi:hypothetical protein